MKVGNDIVKANCGRKSKLWGYKIVGDRWSQFWWVYSVIVTKSLFFPRFLSLGEISDDSQTSVVVTPSFILENVNLCAVLNRLLKQKLPGQFEI